MKKIIETLKKNENDICITIVLSGKLKSFDDKEKIQTRLRKIIGTVKKVVIAEHGEDVANSIVKELNARLLSLDFGKARETLVVYATKGFGKSVWLPFREKERLTIRNSFDLQPLTDAMTRELDYWVLALSASKTRLLRGKNEHLNEVINDKFPLAYEEQFQQHRSHPHALYTSEESKVDKERLRGFFRHLDHLLKPVLQGEHLPIIVMGVQENMSNFKKTSSFADMIAAEIKGNYDHLSSGQVAKKVWPLAKKNIVPEVVS